MPKKPNKAGGGSHTNANGLKFGQTTSLSSALEKAGYLLLKNNV